MKSSSFLIKISLLCISGLILFGCIVILPAMAEEAVFNFPEVAYLKWPVLLGLYATTIPFFYAVYESLQLIRAFNDGKPSEAVVLNSLRSIQICALAILVVYVLGFCMLFASNALPPLLAVIGFGILCVTLFIFAVTKYLCTLIPKYLHDSIT